MSDYQSLREIMKDLPGSAETTEEQSEEANHSRFADSEVQGEIMEWINRENEQVDREPLELGGDVTHDTD